MYNKYEHKVYFNLSLAGCYFLKSAFFFIELYTKTVFMLNTYTERNIVYFSIFNCMCQLDNSEKKYLGKLKHDGYYDPLVDN